MSNKQAILLFELGHLQVFHYQSIEEWRVNQAPTAIFWTKKGELAVHGPFTSIYQAVCNYTSSLVKPAAAISSSTVATVTKDNVIYVDFKTKKRIL